MTRRVGPGFIRCKHTQTRSRQSWRPAPGAGVQVTHLWPLAYLLYETHTQRNGAATLIALPTIRPRPSAVCS